MIDIHCHILPAVDDGSPDWETSLEMCAVASRDGIRKIVATPHVKAGVYDCDRSRIQQGIKELNARIPPELDIEVLEGADVHMAAGLIEKVKAGEVPTINNGCYLLLELPFNSVPPNIEQIVFDFKLAGIAPVISHPERNTFFQKNAGLLSSLVNAGALVQVTAMSLTGGFGRDARKSAEEMLKTGLVHAIATDAHSAIERPPVLSEAVKRASRLVGRRAAQMMVLDVPESIVQGRPIDAPLLIKTKKKWFHG